MKTPPARYLLLPVMAEVFGFPPAVFGLSLPGKVFGACGFFSITPAASCLLSFVTREGVNGCYRVHFDETNKLISVEEIEGIP